MARRRGISTGFAAVLVTVACVVGCAFWVGPWWGMFLGVNVAAFVYYGFDKYRAVTGGWRVPESVLLCFAAAGGAPGSLLGRYLFNHKTSKIPFKRAFWAIVILQAAILAAVIVHLRGGW